MVTLAYLIVLATAAKAAQIKTTRVSTTFDDHLVTQDITIDPDRNTALAITGEVKDWDDFKSSANLHDFNMGFVALKNIADGVCLLKPISLSKSEHLPSSDNIISQNGEKFLAWHKTMYWNKDPKVMNYEEVKLLAGELLAEYCRDYKTSKLSPKPISSLSTNSGNSRRRKRCWIGCGDCFNEVDGYEEDYVDTADKGI